MTTITIARVPGFERSANSLNATADETASILLDVPFHKRASFPHIAHLDSPTRAQAYVVGTRLKVWQVVKVSRALGKDAAATAEYLEIDPLLVDEALAYARQYPVEIEVAIESDSSFDLQQLRRIIPQIEVLQLSADPQQP